MPERANITQVEYQYLRDRWGSQTTRLTGDSMRNFNQCALCLGDAVSPMTCREGHLFCKECILTDLLKQKDDIRKHQVMLEDLAVQQENERQMARERAREKVARDFERGYGFGGDRGGGGSSAAGTKRKQPDTQSHKEGTQSPSDLSALPLRAKQVAEDAENAALAAIEEEQRLSRLSKLPAFWLPSLTPSEKQGQVDLKSLRTSMEPRCRVTSEHGHPISIKSVTAVTFTRAPQVTGSSTSTSTSTIICPGCKKALSNSHRLFTIRSCSHTFCNHCTDELIYLPAKRAAKDIAKEDKKETTKKSSASPPLASCPECSEGIIKNIEKDVIKLHREGTGFASAGGAEGKHKRIAFQG